MTPKITRILIVLLTATLLLPAGAAAQGAPFRVWYALPQEDSRAVTALAGSFANAADLELDAQAVAGSQLFDTAVKQPDRGPDVILAGHADAVPLDEIEYLVPGSARTFFLAGLLDDFPTLAEDLCGDTALAACLWPDTTASMALVRPSSASMDQTARTLCDGSVWLPWCDGGTLPSAAFGWQYDVYLINSAWLDENGLDIPASGDDVQDLRSDYGIAITRARAGQIVTAQRAGMPEVYVINSTLLAEEADAVMASLASFEAAGYWPVVSLDVYGVYLSSAASHPDQAQAFAALVADDPEVRAALVRGSGVLPALSADEIVALGDVNLARYTLQALALLATLTGG